MKEHHGSTICEAVAVVLLGIEMLGNFSTAMDDSNIWGFIHKMFVFVVAMQCAYDIFYQMAIWSNCPDKKWDHKLLLKSIISDCCGKTTTRNTPNSYMKLPTLKVLFQHFPLPLLVVFALFHSLAGAYYFYSLTGFIRQNSMKVAECGWSRIIIMYTDMLAVLIVFLWLRWAIVFYSHEANELQNHEKTWWKIFRIRWKFAAKCICVLSLILMTITSLKYSHGVPYMKTEIVHTGVSPTIWLLQVTTVTLLTFFSCFPHALCQIMTTLVSFLSFVYIKAGPAEIDAEAYSILYLLVPGAMFIAAMVYHVLFSPGTGQHVLNTKIICEIISVFFLFLIIAVICAEKQAYATYAYYH